MKIKFRPIYSLLPSAMAMFLASQPVSALDNKTVASNDKWYERSFEQLLKTKIITSTREEQEIGLSLNNVSVYTNADIKRMGIRSIKELLERTPGFFINHQPGGPAIGSRGFISDNEQFLLLIDGHSQNSIVDKGAGNFFLFPFLEHVERIEILRGPGSTLWGSDAALGIIHIITKDGKGLEGLTASYSLASVDNYQYMNVRAGKQLTDDVNYMFSVTSARSEGFLNEKVDYLPKDGRWEALDDSYEIYFKAQLDDITIYARSADMLNLRPVGSIAIPFPRADHPNLEAYTRRQHNYIDIQHHKKFSNTFNLETRFFSDLIQGFQAQTNPAITDGADFVEISASNKESALGLEMLGKWQANAFHNILTGLRAVQTEIDPISNGDMFPATTSTTTTIDMRSMRAVPEALDRNIAVFIEDDWKVHEAVNLIYGVRVDKNTLREDNTIFLPRLGINWRMDESWAIHYSYTTGYIRPPVGIGFLGQEQYNTNLAAAGGVIYGAQKSQEVTNNDIRITYNADPFSIKWSLFHTTIDNSFSFLYEPKVADFLDPDFLKQILFYVNTNKITTYGNELEFNYVPSENWNIYASLSYVLDATLDDMTGTEFGINYDMNNTAFNFGEGAFVQDGTMAGYPHKMWNIGANVFFSENISANIHYRGWTDMQARKNILDIYGQEVPGPSDRTYGPEHFVDMNLRYENIANTRLNLGFFVKNLLNNDNAQIRTLFFPEDWSDRKRSIGMDISYTF